MPLNYWKWVPTRRESRQGSGLVSGGSTTGTFGFVARGNGVVPVRFHRILTLAALAAALPSYVRATGNGRQASGLPQPVSAQAGATWLARPIHATGLHSVAIRSRERRICRQPQTASWPLPAPSVDPGLAATALSYMEANVDAYVRQYGADGPGQLALLILDAHARVWIRPRSEESISSPASWRPSKRQGRTRDFSARNRRSRTSTQGCTTRASPWLRWTR